MLTSGVTPYNIILEIFLIDNLFNNRHVQNFNLPILQIRLIANIMRQPLLFVFIFLPLRWHRSLAKNVPLPISCSIILHFRYFIYYLIHHGNKQQWTGRIFLLYTLTQEDCLRQFYVTFYFHVVQLIYVSRIFLLFNIQSTSLITL